MGRWVHRLLEKDPESLSGVCAHCGPVTLREDRKGTLRCDVGWREQHRSTSRESEYRAPIGPCDICGEEAQLHRDHDHSCCPGGRSSGCDNCRRGLLCRSCNIGLGMFSDDPSKLKKALDYLERSQVAPAEAAT